MARKEEKVSSRLRTLDKRCVKRSQKLTLITNCSTLTPFECKFFPVNDSDVCEKQKKRERVEFGDVSIRSP